MQDESRLLRTKIRELCVYLHTENSGFVPSQEVDQASLNGVLKLSPLGMLTYVRQKAQDVFEQSRLKVAVVTEQDRKLDQQLEGSRKSATLTTPDDQRNDEVERLQSELEATKLKLSRKTLQCKAFKAAAKQATAPVAIDHKSTQTLGLKVPRLNDKLYVGSSKPRRDQGKLYRCTNVSVSPGTLQLDPTQQMRHLQSTRTSTLREYTTRRQSLASRTLHIPQEQSSKALGSIGGPLQTSEGNLVTLITHLQQRLLLRSSSVARLS
jgi:hypothetical protein